MKAQISKHNFKILNKNKKEDPPRCNCNDPSTCPLPGKCTIPSVVYRATVKDDLGNDKKYVGITAGPFKKRYDGHKGDFRHPEKRTSSTLAGHIWKLKDSNKTFQVTWEVVCKAYPFSPITGRCNLCTTEKWHIIYNPENATLNRRQELFNHCRHKEKLLLIKKLRRLRPNGS